MRDHGGWSIAGVFFGGASSSSRNTKSPIAETAVRHIAALYDVEADVRGHAPEARLAARKKLSAPIVEALKPWFEKQLSLISSGSTLVGDVRYALSHWAGLTRFLEDSCLELDTNPVENAIRPVALTRKNALFAGKRGRRLNSGPARVDRLDVQTERH